MEAVWIGLSGMWLQDSDSLSSGNSRLLMIFVGLAALALLVQAVALVIMAIAAAKARKDGLKLVEEFRANVMPLVTSTQELIRDSSPKVKVITENIVEASHIIRSKAREFDVTASDLNSKTRAQAARVDGMVTSVLDTTAEIKDSIQRGIKIPVREVTGLVNGLKAGLDVLVGRTKGLGSEGFGSERFGSGRSNVPHDRDPGW
jgi:methyl-accepting chemotaxis protein